MTHTTPSDIPGDFTCYIPRIEGLSLPSNESDPQRAEKKRNTGSAQPEAASTLRLKLTIESANVVQPPVTTRVTARALVCSCFRGQYMSATCRKLGANDGGSAETSALEGDVRATMFAAGDEPLPPPEENPWDKDTVELVDLLWAGMDLGRRGHSPTGLIVIAGRTGSGKSDITREFIRQYMNHLVQMAKEHKARRPHLLTYEEPIEKLIVSSPAQAAARGFDYTPRQRPDDVTNLVEATHDALRQTPSLFFVGETRKEKDWRELLRFAGTGHLTITTGHAGSLVEIMSQVLHATKAGTPAERSRIATRVAALVHIRPAEVNGRKVLIPAFWFRSSRSISAFTAEGLGSLLPNRSGGRTARDSFGRSHAVEKLSYLLKLKDEDDLLRQAIEWDLVGA